MAKTIRTNKTTTFDSDVFRDVVDVCEKTGHDWNEVVNDLIRRGLKCK